MNMQMHAMRAMRVMLLVLSISSLLAAPSYAKDSTGADSAAKVQGKEAESKPLQEKSSVPEAKDSTGADSAEQVQGKEAENVPLEDSSSVPEEESGMTTYVMLGTVVAAIVVAAGFFALNSGGSETNAARGSAVLVVGASNSGKTTFFLTLKDGKVCNATTTSMQENEAKFVFAKYDDDDEDAKPLHVIDYPGDLSLSSRLPDFYRAAKVIVFMVDANDKKSIEREAAETMYRMLTHPSIADQSPPLIVACNKSDLILAAKPPVLKKVFETELEKLKKTQGAAEDAMNDDIDNNDSVALGNDGENFEFEKHSPCPVEFIKCSVKNNDLKDLVTRIRECMDS
jgi:signal recognition particle receptor subunit beta